LPTKVKLEWPDQKLAMTLMLSDVKSNVVDATSAARMFSRANLTGYDSFNLARGVVDTPGSVHRAGASVLPTR